MSVNKFLEDLKFLLLDLPEEEREEALEFYRCYFEDAGEGNESKIIAELGSPEKVAYSIREGLKDKEDEGEFTETGYRTYDDIHAPATRYAHKEGESEDDFNMYKEINHSDQLKHAYKEAVHNAKANNKKSDQKKTQTKRAEGKKSGQSKGKPEKKGHGILTPFYVIGQILLGILKVLLTIAAVCIVILLICALVALLILLVSSFVVTIAFLITGIGMLAGGMGLVGVAMLGLTFVAFAVFLLLLAAVVAFCKRGLAGGIRGITNVTGNVIRGRKKKEA